MKVLRRASAGKNAQRRRQGGVEGALPEKRITPLVGHIGMGNLSHSMYAGIGSSGSLDQDNLATGEARHRLA
jgi:hypothetical protein